jgi:hypothetical protein
MAQKVFKRIESFGPQNKSTIKGKVGHSRTGACTARGKCFHGMKKRVK